MSTRYSLPPDARDARAARGARTLAAVVLVIAVLALSLIGVVLPTDELATIEAPDAGGASRPSVAGA